MSPPLQRAVLSKRARNEPIGWTVATLTAAQARTQQVAESGVDSRVMSALTLLIATCGPGGANAPATTIRIPSLDPIC